MKKIALVFLLIPLYAFAQKMKVSLSSENNANGFNIIAENMEYCPVSLEFSYQGKNITSTVANKQTVLLPARKKMILSEIKKIAVNKSWTFNYQTKFIQGDITQTKGDDYLYALPFEKGEMHKIVQGYNGNFSHQGKNALDFDLKTGDKVIASRDGIVIMTKSDSDVGCTKISCKDLANKIIIYHSDGTFGEYAHLKKNGVLVKPGDSVKEGQLIGYSGNTGFSSGPHLHFDVVIYRLNDEDKIYLETKFKTQKHPEGEMLISGKSYE